MRITLYRADTNAIWQEQGMLIVQNADGSESYQLADGSIAGCEPAYADGNPTLYIPHNAANVGAIGPYQRFTREGSAVSCLTRSNDYPHTFFGVAAKVYP